MTAKMEGDFVVFLIGMRINKWWKIHKWLPTAQAMPRMIKELSQKKELGFLGMESYFGRTIFMVQYWESYEKLEHYARAKNHEHFPAWMEFRKRIGDNGDVGIWHETYRISKGNYECIYGNMPEFGLGKVSGVKPIGKNLESASERMKSTTDQKG